MLFIASALLSPAPKMSRNSRLVIFAKFCCAPTNYPNHLVRFALQSSEVLHWPPGTARRTRLSESPSSRSRSTSSKCAAQLCLKRRLFTCGQPSWRATMLLRDSGFGRPGWPCHSRLPSPQGKRASVAQSDTRTLCRAAKSFETTCQLLASPADAHLQLEIWRIQHGRQREVHHAAVVIPALLVAGAGVRRLAFHPVPPKKGLTRAWLDSFAFACFR